MDATEAVNIMQSPLLALPAELRLCIYEILFTPTQYPGPDTPDPSDKASHRLSLLRACQQTYHEAWAIAYSRTTFHIPNLIEPLLDRLLPLKAPLRHTLRYVTITLNLSIAPKILHFLDPWLMELPLEQLTISVSKLPSAAQREPSMTSNRRVEPAYIEERIAYSYIPASSLRFEIQMKNLKRAICHGLQEPSNVKRITLLHDGCWSSIKLLGFYHMLCALAGPEENATRRWDVSLDHDMRAIDIVSASTDTSIAAAFYGSF